jgi:phytoene/squalene synthetase
MNVESSRAMAVAITKTASKQTYYTIRLLADRERTPDAYQAYAYFRWLDDQLDQGEMDKAQRLAFVERQRVLLDGCYQNKPPCLQAPEEQMLVDLIRGDHENHSGLQTYLRNMMAVMAFDAERRGRLITQAELSGYTHNLASAVTEALHYFIGHHCSAPRGQTRYLAVTAAHITHMLRDALEDIPAGYFNIPSEFLQAHCIEPQDTKSDAYRLWVQSQVELARAYFRKGRDYLAQVGNPRCRLAGYAYTARFEVVLDAIERDGYQLRSAYPERKSLQASVRIIGSALMRAARQRHPADIRRPLLVR